MRGTSCTRLTSWTCILVTVWLWLSWTHTWHKANRMFVCMFKNRDNLLLTQGPWFCASRSHVGTSLVTWWSSVSPQPLFFLQLIRTHTLSLSVSVCLSLSKVMTFKVTLNFLVAQASNLILNAPPSPNTIRQLSFICTIRTVYASVKVLSPSGHTVKNDIPLASKW